MEIVLIAVVVIGVAAMIYLTRDIKSADINQDGKLDLADAALAAKHVVQEAKNTADVNNDGKVDVEDAKAAVKVTKAAVKKTAANVGAKTKAAINKATTKKPAAKSDSSRSKKS